MPGMGMAIDTEFERAWFDYVSLSGVRGIGLENAPRIATCETAPVGIDCPRNPAGPKIMTA